MVTPSQYQGQIKVSWHLIRFWRLGSEVCLIKVCLSLNGDWVCGEEPGVQVINLHFPDYEEWWAGKGFPSAPLAGGLVLEIQKWMPLLLFLPCKSDIVPYSRRLGKSRAVYFPQGERKFWDCHKRLRVAHGSPSAKLGLVAEEGIPVGIAKCLSMNKAGCPFTLQSLTWDLGFCTEHLHTFSAVWASYSPAPALGCHRGCVSVGPYKKDGEQALSRWQLHYEKLDHWKQLGAFSFTNCLSLSESPGEMQISKPNARDTESLTGYQMVHLQINA